MIRKFLLAFILAVVPIVASAQFFPISVIPQSGILESPNGTVIAAPSSTPIIDSTGVVWTTTNSGCSGTTPCLAANGTVVGGAAIVELAYVNHTVWQENTDNNWYSALFSGGVWTTPAGPSTQSPLTSPNLTLVTTVATVTNGVNSPAIVDGLFNDWTITGGAQMAINGTAITATSTVTKLCYASSVPWQFGGGFWWPVATINGASTTFGSAVSTSPCATTYRTAFATPSENPLLEAIGGAPSWANFGTIGGTSIWGNMRKTTGIAFGAGQPTPFGDPGALLTGVWGQDQTVQGTVRIVTGGIADHAEIELHLHQTVTSGSVTGYEFNCSVGSSGYMEIVRWEGNPNNGPGPGGFQYIAQGASVDHCVNGDIINVSSTGNPPTFTVTRTRGGVTSTIYSGITDTLGGNGPYVGGAPGLGVFRDGSQTFSNYGWSAFSATGNN